MIGSTQQIHDVAGSSGLCALGDHYVASVFPGKWWLDAARLFCLACLPKINESVTTFSILDEKSTDMRRNSLSFIWDFIKSVS